MRALGQDSAELLSLLQDQDGKVVRTPGARERDERDLASQRAILCGTCQTTITTRAARIEVHGAHEHRRVNPSGVDFHLGCFSVAPGCLVEGTPTLFWTWFPGYAWQLASCRACGDHLGWAFSNAERLFWGLILPRLVEG